MSEDAREMYRAPAPKPSVVDESLREALARRSAVAHVHKPDEVCPVPGCPSVVVKQVDHEQF